MTNITNAYGPFFKGWLKQYGSKPSEAALTQAGHFGRVGKQTLALAMALRDEGVTAGQIQMVCGAPQNNHRRDVITAGWFKRDMTVPATEAGHTVYKLALTQKGEREIEKRVKANADKVAGDGKPAGKAKASKAKAKRKPKAAPAPVEAPAVVNEPQQGDGAQATT